MAPIKFRAQKLQKSPRFARSGSADVFAGDVFIFRSKRLDRLKILMWDGSGLCLLAKRLEAGAFTWPPVRDGSVTLSAAQLRLLLTGMDWTRLETRASESSRADAAQEKNRISV
jgi:transposase